MKRSRNSWAPCDGSARLPSRSSSTTSRSVTSAGARLRGIRKRSGLAGLRELTRSAEHTSELPSLMRISYAVFCLQKQKSALTHTRYALRRANTRPSIERLARFVFDKHTHYAPQLTQISKLQIFTN